MASTIWCGFTVLSHLNCPRMKAAAQELADTYKEGVDVGYSNPNGPGLLLSDRCRDAIIAVEDRMIAELGALPGYSPKIIAQRTLKNDKRSNRYRTGQDTEIIHGTKLWLSQLCIGLLANIEHEAMTQQYIASIPTLEATITALQTRLADTEASLKASEDRQIAVAAAAILAGQKLKEQEAINAKLMERLATLEKILL